VGHLMSEATVVARKMEFILLSCREEIIFSLKAGEDRTLASVFLYYFLIFIIIFSPASSVL
jgi:hypothetical protein